MNVYVCIDDASPERFELDSVPKVGQTIHLWYYSRDVVFEVLDVVYGKGGPQVVVTPIG